MGPTKDSTVAVVGLGYVGLPLAVEFGKRFRTVGYDLSKVKVEAYRCHEDPTGEVSRDDMKAANLLDCTTNPSHLASADFVVVAVPTPVDAARKPDFGPLLSACETVGRYLKRGALVIFESTVYPGGTASGNAVSSSHVACKTRRAGSMTTALSGTASSSFNTAALAAPVASTKIDLACLMTGGVMVSRSQGSFGPTTATTRRPASFIASFPGKREAI